MCEVSDRVCAPSAEYPQTFATAWMPPTLELRQMQLVVSAGTICGDCAYADPRFDDVRVGEWIRLAEEHRCRRCGRGPTRWYHLADQERTEEAVRAYASAA